MFVARSWNFGDRVNAQIQNCRFYPDEAVAMLDLAIGWTGPFSRQYYEMLGELELRGGRYEWRPTRSNAALQEFERERNEALVVTGMLAGAAAALGAAFSDDEEDKGGRRHEVGMSRLCLENGTTGSLSLPVRWTTQTEWEPLELEPGGWWQRGSRFVGDSLLVRLPGGVYALPPLYSPQEDLEGCPEGAHFVVHRQADTLGIWHK